MFKKLFWLCLIGLVLLSVCVSCFFSLAAISAVSSGTTPVLGNEFKFVYGNSSSTNKILQIPLNGVIMNDKVADGGLFTTQAVYGYDIKDQLYKAADDKTIKGVILDIDSPGGTVVGAKAISDGVEYYRQKTHNPIIAHITGEGASGAYLAAVSTDYISADIGSISADIGVIFGPFTYYDKVVSEGSILGYVTTQNGIQEYYVTGGKSKDLGNPFRQVTTDELAVIQAGVDEDYNFFVTYVSQRRDIPEATIKTKIKALFYANQQAIDFKLIDASGSRQDAYTEIAKRANFTDDYQIVEQQSAGGFLSQLLGSQLKQQPANAKTICSVICGQPLMLHGDPNSY